MQPANQMNQDERLTRLIKFTSIAATLAHSYRTDTCPPPSHGDFACVLVCASGGPYSPEAKTSELELRESQLKVGNYLFRSVAIFHNRSGGAFSQHGDRPTPSADPHNTPRTPLLAHPCAGIVR
jgi:hypothetical protein